MTLTKQDLEAIGSLVNEQLAPIRTEICFLKQAGELILQQLKNLMQDVAGFKCDIAGFKSDLEGFKHDMAGFKADIAGIKIDVESLKRTAA